MTGIKYKHHSKEVLHGWRDPNFEYPIFTKGYNANIEDIHGNVFLDLDSQGLVNMLGNNIAKINSKLVDQINTLCYVSPMYGDTIPEILYAQKLIKLLNFKYTRVYFGLSGSFAVDTALKIARYVTHKKIVVSFKDAFHGVIKGALDCSGMDDIKDPFFAQSSNYVNINGPLCKSCTQRSEESCSLRCITEITACLDKIGSTNIAALIAEPFLSNICEIPKIGFWNALHKELKSRKILLVGDEISTGFGRIGEIYAFNYWKVNPDILIFGKNITSGILPLSVVLLSPKVNELLGNSIFKHGFSFEGHVLCCTAALACLEYYDSIDWLSLARKQSIILKHILSARELINLDIVNDVRSFGLIGIIELKQSESERIKNLCLKNNIIIGGFFNYLRVSPSLFVEERDIEKGLNVLTSILKTL